MYRSHLCPAQGQTPATTLVGHFCALQALLWGPTVLRQHGGCSGGEDTVGNRDPADHENSWGPGSLTYTPK